MNVFQDNNLLLDTFIKSGIIFIKRKPPPIKALLFSILLFSKLKLTLSKKKAPPERLALLFFKIDSLIFTEFTQSIAYIAPPFIPAVLKLIDIFDIVMLDFKICIALPLQLLQTIFYKVEL